VRELENALEYAVAVCKGQTMLLEDLPVELQHGALDSEAVPSARPPVAATGATPDSVHIRRALEAHRWRRAEAAHALGISRATLWRRMREAGLSNP
jgi:transcriptional regulator of acetoin/glycerol metabolism